jgi:FAD/FMN-containing dehydrogenase
MSDVTANGCALDERTVSRLRARMRGAVLTPNDDGYGSARQIWNAMIDRRPGVIARCTGSEDVRTAVTCARENDLLISIRGGGHNIAAWRCATTVSRSIYR